MTETTQEALDALMAKAEQEPESPETSQEGVETPLEAPNSMSAEEKEQFAELPREMQEYLVTHDSSQREYFRQRTDELSATQEGANAAKSDADLAKQKYLEQIESTKPQPPKRSEFQKDDYFDRDAFDAAQLGYESRMELHEEKEAEVSKIKEEMKVEEQKSFNDFQRKTAEEMQQNWPELVDPATGPQLQADVVNYLSANLGIDQAKASEVLKTTSGMELLLVRKAMQADNAKTTMQVNKPSSKGIKPGSPTKPPVSEKLQKEKRAAIDKLRDGNIDAAVKYLIRPAER